MNSFSSLYRLDEAMTDVTEARNIFRLLDHLYDQGFINEKPLSVELKTLESKLEDANPQRCLNVNFE